MAASVNKVFIVGTLGRNPELRHTKNETPVCVLNVATTNGYKTKAGERKQETEWHRVTVWGVSAENCARYLAKGKFVHVEGHLKTETWEKDGVRRYATGVVAEKVVFLPGQADDSMIPPANTTTSPEPTDDDIPF